MRVWLALGLVFGSVDAFASSAGGVAAPSGAIARRLGPGGCKSSQACLYQRANEALGLQAIYLLEKATELNRDFNSPNGGTRWRSELSQFCKIQKRNAGGLRSSDNECMKSYLLQVQKGLRQIRGAIARNQDAMTKLAGQVGSADLGGIAGEGPEASPGPEAGRAWDVRFDGQLRKDAPFVPNLQLLRDGFLDQMEKVLAARQLSPQESQVMELELGGWWDSYPKCPDRDEFIAVEMVERFPANPTGEMIRRIKTNPDGSSVVDQKAYEKAQADCAVQRAEWAMQVRFATQQEAQAAANAKANPRAPDLLVGGRSPISEAIFDDVQKFVLACTSGKQPAGSSAKKCGSAAGSGGGQSGRPNNGFYLTESYFESADQEIGKILQSMP